MYTKQMLEERLVAANSFLTGIGHSRRLQLAEHPNNMIHIYAGDYHLSASEVPQEHRALISAYLQGAHGQTEKTDLMYLPTADLELNINRLIEEYEKRTDNFYVYEKTL